jgi:excisionase family DNA binding protein
MIGKLAYTIAELADLTSICRTRLYQEISHGRLRTFKSGRSTLIHREDAEAWLSALRNATTTRAA